MKQDPERQAFTLEVYRNTHKALAPPPHGVKMEIPQKPCGLSTYEASFQVDKLQDLILL